MKVAADDNKSILVFESSHRSGFNVATCDDKYMPDLKLAMDDKDSPVYESSHRG